MKKGKKKSISVFRQLVTGYILFSVLLVTGLYICLFGVLIGLGGGSIGSLAPYQIVNEDGTMGDTSAWERSGGWVEMLDKEYHVIEVYGQKLDTPQEYTQKEIYEYLNTDKVVNTDTSAEQYRGFLKTAEKDGDTVYYFMKIGRNILSLTYNYNVGSSSGSQKIALVFLGVFFFFFCGVCFLMSRYLSRKIRLPLNKIIHGMEQVIKHGVDQVRLDFDSQREFEEIRDSFNIMTERLETEKREKRIDEEKKNRMLLELSHDIKTPVSTIKSYANALEENLVKPEDLNECYQTVEKKAERVDELINEMFLLLKLDNTEYKFERERTDLCELMRTSCALYYGELEAEGIQMEIEIPEAPIWAELDKKEFSRVIENLLGNICKYNETGHHAWVSVREKEGKAEIWIEDDGDEIAGEIKERMFDPFVRGDKARSSKGGTGLGLAIAKKTVEKLGGEITYRYENQRNQFVVYLGGGRLS